MRFRLLTSLLLVGLVAPPLQAQFRKFPTTIPVRPPTNFGNFGGGYGSPSPGFNGGFSGTFNNGNAGFSGNFGNLGGGFASFPLPVIFPGTPTQELIPASLFGHARPWWGQDLRRVPEVGLTGPLAENASGVQDLVRVLASALHLDQQQRDGFIDALEQHRPDLAGLPFRKGEACRSSTGHMVQFEKMRDLVRSTALTARTPAADFVGPMPQERSHQMGDPERFWKRLPSLVSFVRIGPLSEQAQVAALMQMCGPETPALQAGLVDVLREMRGVDAAEALARLVLFGPDRRVREAALDALRGRPEEHYTAILVEGLRYPWPAVAERAAAAIASLERTDLLPTLVATLDQADPRLPRTFSFFGSEVHVVRELVRVNHHRNCLLCHAPIAPTAVAQPGTDFFGGIPLPDRPLGSLATYYGGGGPQVAFNATYLRQDFSLMQRVEEPGVWSELQRFDFFVRKRVVTPREAELYEETVRRDGQDAENPYRRAAVGALRSLTGQDAPPTAEAWRRRLELTSLE